MSCALIVATDAGCSAGVGSGAAGIGSDAKHYATVTAGTITTYLQDNVVRPGQPAATQFAKLRRWVADPSPDYTRSFTYPDVHVIAATSRHVDVVVYESTRGQLFDGDEVAQGAACVRYTIGSTHRLQARSIACPSTVSG